MKIIIDGQERELKELEKGEKELDRITEKEAVDLEDTKELTEEELERIKEESVISNE